MFQYAAGRALAERLGTELVLDTRNFDRYTLYDYGLDKFAIRAQVSTSEQLKRWPSWIGRWSHHLRSIGIRTSWYVERQFHYDNTWASIPDGTMIAGYFQSEQYFPGMADALRQEFVPIAPLSPLNEHYAELARNTESVMIHVRRGDYVTNVQTLTIHGVCSVDYYRAAIAAIREQVTTPRFFVFANDMHWARDNLPLGQDAVFVAENSQAPEVDIHLMAQCRHHVIANSTFSWWGAFLSKGPNKIVIAPQPWFDSQKIVEKDLIPNNWIRYAK